MPTTYAHWRFGDRAQSRLPEDLRAVIARHRALFDFGTQGPDVFFHYDCLRSNDVSRYGTALHKTPMTDILALFGKNLLACEDREAAEAYFLGFLTHFLADSYCHGYIERKEKAEGPSHSKIEAQLDRHLLVKDGSDPNKTKPAAVLKPSASGARIMAQLYGVWDERVMLKAQKDQVFYRGLLQDTNAVKRAFLTAAMKAVGAKKYCDMMIGPGEDPLCVSSGIRLEKLLEKAEEHYPRLAQNMLEVLLNGAAPDPYFRHHFGPKEGWESIPLLTPEEERAFCPDMQD